jgi:hypothetical protein
MEPVFGCSRCDIACFAHSGNGYANFTVHNDCCTRSRHIVPVCYKAVKPNSQRPNLLLWLNAIGFVGSG